MKKICVIGSINVDIVTSTEKFPKPGETVTGHSFNIFPGGKGANQAVAAGKLGADVTFLGKIGNDSFGKLALEAMNSAGVETSYIETAPINTGAAVITVDKNGENSIICVPGANKMVDVDFLRQNIAVLKKADIVLLQLEIPMKTVEWAAEYAAKNQKTTILDPAPASRLSPKLLKHCNIITPNENEFKTIFGMSVCGGKDLKNAAIKLATVNSGTIIQKCGSKGAYYYHGGNVTLVPGYKVKVMDTTAAGDSFNAGLSYALAYGMDLENSIRYANAVGAISVTKMGAQSAMPTRIEVDALLGQERGTR